MFLEKAGKFFFSQMRPLFFFFLALLPLAISTFYLSEKGSNLQALEERFSNAARKERLAFERKSRKERFLSRYSKVNPYFLDQEIEGFELLQNEKQKLESLLHHPAFPESEAIRNRLAFLAQNRLQFTEEKIESNSQQKEIEEKQRHPVQMDEKDLKQILALIEDVQIEEYGPKQGSPQILIKELSLKKIETPLQTEVFEVEMDLLKREFSEL